MDSTIDLMLEKTRQAQILYEYLTSYFQVKPDIPLSFVLNDDSDTFIPSFLKVSNNPPVDYSIQEELRLLAPGWLHERENIYQTGILGAVLALLHQEAMQVARLRHEERDAHIYCNITYAGLQSLRMYYVHRTEGNDFTGNKLKAAIAFDDSVKRSFHHYLTKDNRYVTFHNYNRSQQIKLMRRLIQVKTNVNFDSMSYEEEVRFLTEAVKKYNGAELEEISLNCGACACVVRSREEWEAHPVGKAVKDMPILVTQKWEGQKLHLDKPTTKGPLSGLKVLEVSPGLAGPNCGRMLAEFGADVLMVRRGSIKNQVNELLEMDGWAGKKVLSLDFHDPQQLQRMKELIKEADVMIFSYQHGCMDQYGLSEEEIRKINPELIYADVICFSNTIWKEKPGWAPLVEDISGVSYRNGGKENPRHLNGVNMDYITGYLLAFGVINAVKEKIEKGTTTQITASMAKTANLLHEFTDYCNQYQGKEFSTDIQRNILMDIFSDPGIVADTCLGKITFPRFGTYCPLYPDVVKNMSIEEVE